MSRFVLCSLVVIIGLFVVIADPQRPRKKVVSGSLVVHKTHNSARAGRKVATVGKKSVNHIGNSTKTDKSQARKAILKARADKKTCNLGFGENCDAAGCRPGSPCTAANSKCRYTDTLMLNNKCACEHGYEQVGNECVMKTTTIPTTTTSTTTTTKKTTTKAACKLKCSSQNNVLKTNPSCTNCVCVKGYIRVGGPDNGFCMKNPLG